MGAVVRILKVLSYAIWISTSLLGTLIFYNMSQVSVSFSTNPQMDRIDVYIDIRYGGILFDLKFSARVSLLGSKGEELSSDSASVILRPGETKTIVLTCLVENITAISGYRLRIRIDQVVEGYEMLGIELEHSE